MYQAHNPLHLILNYFKESGWNIDYSTLTLSGTLASYMKHTQIFMFAKFSEEEGIVTLTCEVSTRYPFCTEALDFLEHMKSNLDSIGIEFVASPPAMFIVSWSSKYVSSPLSPVRSDLLDLIRSKITQIQRFVFSCAHVINAYGRMKQRNRSTKTEIYMYPQFLSIFCIPELQEGGCSYYN